MDIFIKATQLILSLSILVVLHELGHFLPAKWFKTRVEKFYLFFNPGFSLAKFKKGETEYGIGWLPLGGYVKIAGMIDESMDTEAMKEEPKPWEFRSKPAWQRLIIMIGGVVVNLILGFIIYSGVLMAWGEEYIEPQNAAYGLQADSLMQVYGFQDGDKILSCISDGERVEMTKATGINIMLLLDDITKVEVLRGEEKLELPIPEDMGQQMVDNGVKSPFDLRIPFVVDSVLSDKGAEKAGLQKGDVIKSVNGVESKWYGDLSKEIKNHPEAEVDIVVDRGGQTLSFSINTDEDGLIGIGPRAPSKLEEFAVTHKEYSFFEALPAGFNKAGEILRRYAVSMKFLFSKKGAQQAGGFIAIGNMFPGEWDWQSFWLNTAFLSIILAFMNILPIPALDGGHVMFLLYEIIAGRKPNDKFMERAQLAGIILLLTLMLLINGNDIYKLIMSKF